jgi:hypothetical protein
MSHYRSVVPIRLALNLIVFLLPPWDDNLESMNQHFGVCGSILTVAVATGALAQQATLPPLKRQGSPEAVVKEHMAAINACDWKRILGQIYT